MAPWRHSLYPLPLGSHLSKVRLKTKIDLPWGMARVRAHGQKNQMTRAYVMSRGLQKSSSGESPCNVLQLRPYM